MDVWAPRVSLTFRPLFMCITSLLGPGYALLPGHHSFPHALIQTLSCLPLTTPRPDANCPPTPCPPRFPQDVVSSLKTPRRFHFTLHSLSGRLLSSPAMGMVAPFSALTAVWESGPDRQDMLRVTGLVISEADPTSNVGVRNPGLTAYSDLDFLDSSMTTYPQRMPAHLLGASVCLSFQVHPLNSV